MLTITSNMKGHTLIKMRGKIYSLNLEAKGNIFKYVTGDDNMEKRICHCLHGLLQQNYHTLGYSGWLINHKHLFLTILESQKSKIKTSADPMSGKIQCLLRAHLLNRQQICRRSLESHRGSVFMTHLPKIPPPNTSTLGLRFQTMSFRRKQTLSL